MIATRGHTARGPVHEGGDKAHEDREGRLAGRLSNLDLIVIDDLGYLPCSQNGS
ncbi:MAG: hypothetical protein HQL31_07145 [Planctomycetes bacterium]|nr:hypothetical protein [Planctomycetota bacterium]